MKKKWIKVILLTMILSVSILAGIPYLSFIAAADEKAAAVPTEGEWFIFDQTTNTINGYSQDTSAPRDIVIPAQINGVDVLKIADKAFLNVNQFTSVAFEEGSKVAAIGNYAFQQCTNLETISLPDSLTTLGQYAFAKCTSLTEIVIPEGVTEIKTRAFSECNALMSVELGKNVITLGQYAFYSCTKLTDINFPNGLNEIADQAFEKAGLTEVNLPDSVTTMGKSAFASCTKLETVRLSSGLKKIAIKAFEQCTSLGGIVIPDSVTNIQVSAFSECTNMKTLTLGNQLERIESRAFFGCEALTELDIPKSVQTIATDALENSGLRYIRIPEVVTDGIANAPWRARKAAVIWKTSVLVKDSESENEYVYEYDEDTNIGRITKYIIHNTSDTTADIATDFAAANVTTSVDWIDTSAFYGTAVTNVVIPDTVTKIDTYAFYWCTSLKKITLSAQLENINAYAFYNCQSLSEIHFPDSLKSIGDQAFYNCKTLKDFVLPKQLNHIGRRAFELCSNITTVTIPGTVKELSDRVFYKCERLALVTIENGVETIKAEAFRYCVALFDITIPGSVKTIEGDIFTGDNKLKYIRIPEIEKDGILGSPWSASNAYVLWKGTQVIPGADGKDKYLYEWNEAMQEGSITKYLSLDITADIVEDFRIANVPTPVTKIDKYAFNKCGFLKTVVFPETVREIDDYAFYENTSLSNVQFPSGLKRIGAQAFIRCTSISKLELPSGLEEIGENAFKNLNAITEVVIPKSLKTIGAWAFTECGSLNKVEFQEGTKIAGGSRMFQKCNALKEIVFPSTITTISEYIFRDCAGLESVSIPSSVTNIERYAFSKCTSLDNVLLPDSVTTLGEGVFEESTALKTVRLSNNLKTIPKALFHKCSSLETISIPNSVTQILETAFADTALSGELKIPSNVRQIAATAFQNVTTLERLVIPYARKKCPYVSSDPYTLDTTKTEIVYHGGTPVIEHTLSERQEDGTYKLDFKISFKDGKNIVDGVNTVVLPNPDGSAGTTQIEVGGKDAWDTASTGHTILIDHSGNYKIKIAGLDGELHEYTVYIGAPEINTTFVELYTKDLHTITEQQLLYVFGLIDKDGNTQVKDEFGNPFACDVSILPDELEKLKALKAGENATINIRIVGEVLKDSYDFSVNVTSALLHGTIIWDDIDNVYGYRPEQVDFTLVKNGTEQIETKTIIPDEDGNWKFQFEAPPWEAVDVGGVVGTLHIGDEITYTVTTSELANYTTTFSKTSSDMSCEYQITNRLIPPVPYTGIDGGQNGMWCVGLAVCFPLVFIIRKKYIFKRCI